MQLTYELLAILNNAMLKMTINPPKMTRSDKITRNMINIL